MIPIYITFFEQHKKLPYFLKFEISKNKLELACVAPAIKFISINTSNPIWINILPATIKEYFEEVVE